MDTSGTHMEQPQKDKNQNIQVFVRVRPLNQHERTRNSHTILDCNPKEVVVRSNLSTTTKTFTFDRVFSPTSKQIEVYKTVVIPLLEQVLLGYNCTVFAYGQTGTGKTFTMEGERSSDPELTWENDPLSGIIPRALSQLFDDLRVQNVEFTVRVSFLELYNEELFDLLSPNEDNKFKTLRIFDDASKKGSIIVQGLEEVTVLNKQEVYNIMERGSQRRQTAATTLNAKSSRSHTIFTITVHIKESNVEGEELLKIGKLHLVDLAGSENIGRSGAESKRAREAGSINQSLLTLGRVITSLVDRAPHIPYRESKLTRLLQDSLGGRTKTSIIATVSPSSLNHDESLNTLDYAHRAKNIMNRPEVNQKLTKKEMLKSYTEEVERLRRDLMATREKNGVYLDKDNYDNLIAKVEMQGQDLSEKIVQVRSLQESLEKKEEENAATTAVLKETTEELEVSKVQLLEAQELVKRLEGKLFRTELERDENRHLVHTHVNTEVKLTDEASTLLTVVKRADKDLEKLHYKHEYKKNLLNNIYADARKFRNQFAPELEEISQSIDKFRNNHNTFYNNASTKMDQFLEEKNSQMNDISCEIIYFLSEMKRYFSQTNDQMTANEDKINTWKEELGSGMNEKKESALKDTEEFLANLEFGKILESLKDLQQKLDIIGQDTSQKAKEQFEIVETFSKASLKEIAGNQKVLEEYLAQQMQMLEKSVAKCKLAKEQGNDFMNNVKDVTNKAMADMQRILVQAAEYEKKMTQMEAEQNSDYKESLSLSKTFAKSMGSYFDKGKVGFEEHTAKLSDLTNKGIENSQKNVNELKEANKVNMNLVTATRGKVEKNSEQSLNKWESACEFTSTKENELRGIMYSFRGETEETLQDLEEFADCKMEQIKQKTDYGLEIDTKHVVEMKGDFEKEEEGTQEFANEQRNSISYKQGKFCEFAESIYAEKLDSFGATPKRQDLMFPNKLTATSPHERILDRYRRERNELYPLDFGEEEDEDKENSGEVEIIPEKEILPEPQKKMKRSVREQSE